MKKTLFSLLTLFAMLTASAQDIYQFTARDADGRDVSLSEYRGKVLLIVNTATRCGFTPQYTELERLYEALSSEGLEVLDFPCNQFGEQAPGTIQEIRQFCTSTYNTRFPQFDKVEVNGDGQHPLFAYLKQQKGFNGFGKDNQMGDLLDKMLSKADPDYAKKPDIKWNFTKFLVSCDGRVVARFEPTAPMSDVETAVRLLLASVDEKTQAADEDEIMGVVEKRAQFPGGEEACMKWLAANVQYPKDCEKKGIEGRVLVSFVVEKDGTLSNIKVVRSPHLSLSKEAERVIKAMPKWKPGTIADKAVRSRFTIPIMFQMKKKG